MKTANLFFFIIIIFLFVGCKQSCPDFPVQLIEIYIPYKDGERILFKNSQNDTLSTIIVNTNYSGDAFNTSVSRNCKCDCEATYEFVAKDEFNINGKFTVISLPGQLYHDYVSFNITVLSNSFFIKRNDKNIVNMFSENNYAIFGDTIVLEHEQNTVTIIKGKGITEWTDGDGEVWKLME